MKMRTLAVLVLFVGLSACAGLGGAEPATATPAAPTATEAPVLPTPTSLPPTAEIPLATATLPAPQVIPNPQLTTFHMNDFLAGWGVSAENVLHTSDGGLTWMDATPLELRGGTLTLNGSAYLNGSTAWLLLNSTEKPVGLYHTADGGNTWQMHSVPFTNARMQFLDGQNGFALSSLGAAAGSEAVSLFRTADGGATWVQVYTNQPEAAGTSDSLPFGGQKSGMTFLDAEHGWIAGNSPTPGAVYLFATNDGGLTWNPVALTLPEGFTNAMTEVQPAVFYTPLAGVLPVRLAAEPTSFVFYNTADGGLTWTATFPLNVSAQGGMSSLLDLTLWDGGEYIYVSHDTGLTWARVQTNVDLSMTLMKYEFADALNGWALTGDSLSHHTFYKTSDGGATWVLLIP